MRTMAIRVDTCCVSKLGDLHNPAFKCAVNFAVRNLTGIKSGVSNGNDLVFALIVCFIDLDVSPHYLTRDVIAKLEFRNFGKRSHIINLSDI